MPPICEMTRWAAASIPSKVRVTAIVSVADNIARIVAPFLFAHPLAAFELFP
jgi:hypothetical protein